MEYMAAAGAAAFIVGKDGILATLDATASYSSDTPDYWRLDGDRYFMWGGQAMTATHVGMATHMGGAVKAVLTKAGVKSDDIAAVAIQQRDGASVYGLAQRLGFGTDKVAPGICADKIGDCGAASSMVSLAIILETAEANQKLLLVSYGWGAGSDAFVLTVKEENNRRKPRIKVNDLLQERIVVDYATALKYERKLDSADLKVTAFA